jgi:hypothetical protein
MVILSSALHGNIQPETYGLPPQATRDPVIITGARDCFSSSPKTGYLSITRLDNKK